MENALSILFSLPTIIFCISLYLFVLVGRKLVESVAAFCSKFIPAKLSKYNSWFTHIWEEWALPATPVVLGGLFAAFVKQYPYPDAVAASEMARIFYGLVCGWASAYVYRSVKVSLRKVLPQRMSEEVEDRVNFVAGANPPDPEKLEK